MKELALTVFNAAHDCAVLQTDIHLQVLDADTHVIDARLVEPTLFFELLCDLLEESDFFSILSNSIPVSICCNQCYTQREKVHLLVNLRDFVTQFGV